MDSCKRFLIAHSGAVEPFLERTRAVAFRNAKTGMVVCHTPRRQYAGNPRNHLPFWSSETEVFAPFQQIKTALFRARLVKRGQVTKRERPLSSTRSKRC